MNIDEMLLTEKEINDIGNELVSIPEFIDEADEYKAFLFSRRYYAKAQHEKDMSYVIREDRTCGFCVGRKKLKNIFTGAILNCSHCNGTGKDPNKPDKTLGDLVKEER